LAATGLLYIYLKVKYLPHIVRVFQERPLFIIPRGQSVADAEDVYFPTEDGLTLHGCYLHTSSSRRNGVVLFGLEFGSNVWACVPYCEQLLAGGFDIFTFEPRNVGDSECQQDYEPLQWVTDLDVKDFQAAIAYLKGRSDGDPAGIGFFGISKGGSAGVIAAANDAYIRCCVTDGIFATYTTMVPYMRKWVGIFSKRYFIQVLLPTWFYGLVGRAALRRISRDGGYRFPHLEKVISRVSPRALLMFHGEADVYIKPEMARALYDLAKEPKEFRLVQGAKHNQALNVAGEDYHKRVCDFFKRHLAAPQPARTTPEMVEAV
jgi:dipeptidyl aminopeptidase/acylaminoacyl peptidase